MKNTAARRIILATVAMTICLGFGTRTLARQPSSWNGDDEQYRELCPSLKKAHLTDLLQFLQNATADASNKYCVAWAIANMEDSRYEPAIPALVKLLDFPRPPAPLEQKTGVIQHIMPAFPAVQALWKIGPAAAPAVLHAIEAAPTSALARSNAVLAWVMIWNSSKETRYPSVLGVAQLKREEMSATDNEVKQRLEWAIQQAMVHCVLPGAAGPQVAACQQAAKDGTVPQ